MGRLEETLENLLQGLPPLGLFLAVGVSALSLLAGLLFACRARRPIASLGPALEAFLGWTVALLLMAMVFLSGLQILLRNVFRSGFPWIDPLLRHLVLLLAFAGAVLAAGLKRHVQINVIGRLLRGRAKRVAGTAVAALSAGICLALTRAALLLLRDELEYGGSALLQIPSWVVVALFPAFFASLALMFLYVALLEAAGEAPETPEETAGFLADVHEKSAGETRG